MRVELAGGRNKHDSNEVLINVWAPAEATAEHSTVLALLELVASQERDPLPAGWDEHDILSISSGLPHARLTTAVPIATEYVATIKADTPCIPRNGMALQRLIDDLQVDEAHEWATSGQQPTPDELRTLQALSAMEVSENPPLLHACKQAQTPTDSAIVRGRSPKLKRTQCHQMPTTQVHHMPLYNNNHRKHASKKQIHEMPQGNHAMQISFLSVIYPAYHPTEMAQAVSFAFATTSHPRKHGNMLLRAGLAISAGANRGKRVGILIEQDVVHPAIAKPGQPSTYQLYPDGIAVLLIANVPDREQDGEARAYDLRPPGSDQGGGYTQVGAQQDAIAQLEIIGAVPEGTKPVLDLQRCPRLSPWDMRTYIMVFDQPYNIIDCCPPHSKNQNGIAVTPPAKACKAELTMFTWPLKIEGQDNRYVDNVMVKDRNAELQNPAHRAAITTARNKRPTEAATHASPAKAAKTAAQQQAGRVPQMGRGMGRAGNWRGGRGRGAGGRGGRAPGRGGRGAGNAGRNAAGRGAGRAAGGRGGDAAAQELPAANPAGAQAAPAPAPANEQAAPEPAGAQMAPAAAEQAEPAVAAAHAAEAAHAAPAAPPLGAAAAPAAADAAAEDAEMDEMEEYEHNLAHARVGREQHEELLEEFEEYEE